MQLFEYVALCVLGYGFFILAFVFKKHRILFFSIGMVILMALAFVTKITTKSSVIVKEIANQTLNATITQYTYGYITKTIDLGVFNWIHVLFAVIALIFILSDAFNYAKSRYEETYWK